MSPLSASSGVLPIATGNTAYTAIVAPTGGVLPYSFQLDPASASLPAGLTFSAQGTFSGTPTATVTTNGILVDVTAMG